MATLDPRIDAYIEKAAPFARPVLEHLRKIVHKGCPEVVETIKWGMPAFEHRGLLCGMAAFKAHCVFGFWKAAVLFEEGGPAGSYREKLSWGATGKDPVPSRITGLSDLPPARELTALVERAAELNEAGVKVPPRRRASAKPEPVAPPDLVAALKRVRGAAARFRAFSPSHKREYVEWIEEAKREETRRRRVATAVEWIAEGKSRNWKYERKR